MKHPSALLCGVAFAIALAGCAGNTGVRQWGSVSPAEFHSLTPGTTKDEVVRRVGQPYEKVTFPWLKEEVWSYQFVDDATFYVGEAHFDPQGRLRFFTDYIDPAFSSSIGDT